MCENLDARSVVEIASGWDSRAPKIKIVKQSDRHGMNLRLTILSVK